MERIKVLIVDDSAFMRKLLHDFLSENQSIEVIGTARNGEDAIKKIQELKPDVVTMDIEMPILNGLEALRYIMRTTPLPIVMLSSTTQNGAENTILACSYGAVDFVAKPSGAISLDLHKIKEELIQKVISASKVKMHQLMINNYAKSTTNVTANYSKIERERPIDVTGNSSAKKIVCIGTSTGGPRALQQVIGKLPKDFNAPVLVVQHMPAGFTKSLANRLNSISDVNVKEAVDGETVNKGTVYIAPGGMHLKIKELGTNLTIQLDATTPPRNGHRPSVDVMFESISRLRDYQKIAVIMTGMGMDGTKGLQELKKCGPVTAIAESQETSIVYGMPKAAVATKLVDEVQNVENIAETILKYV
ncbi:protein-glutamate methylesterase/protein-glutamine glutaminase [Bacillus dakarensis]|uniref:protein-glutamate methylesterase/protein-glutamine glutaminase n=1 Tax=Robertmurraya dakarensis TaxID=1926278 RepID=UPI000980EEFF|nr:chemotaxis response regulator protein-glutamate methylesterase [Bacillus dakarensis]